MYSSLNDSGYRVLEYLGTHSTTDHNINDINAGLSYLLAAYEIEGILKVFHQEGYISEVFTVDNVLDMDSKAETRYKITSQGNLFWLEQQGFRKYGRQTITDLEEDYPDAAEEKRKRRNMLIAFALILIIGLATVILVPVLNG